MNLLNILYETTSDGPGTRCSIYVAGCNHYCDSCHNSHSWDFNQGTNLFEELPSIIAYLKENTFLNGITFSGGDPMCQPEDFLEVLKIICSNLPGINIWCYTGYILEEIWAEPYKKECLSYLDVLVDGSYDKNRPTQRRYIGSDNQRIIDIKKLLNSKEDYYLTFE